MADLDEKGLEAARRKGREMAGNMPGALIESFAEIAAAGAKAYIDALPPPVTPARDVVEALKQIAYERCRERYGFSVADALVNGGWRWPESAPNFIDTSLYRAITALASLAPAQGGREGGAK